MKANEAKILVQFENPKTPVLMKQIRKVSKQSSITVRIGALKKNSSKFVFKLVILEISFLPTKQTMIDPNDSRGIETIYFEKQAM